MFKLINIFLLFTTILASSTYATAQDATGPDCQKILIQKATAWVNSYSAKLGGSTLDIRKAIGIYGNCFDQRTARLYQQLIKSGHSPLMGAVGNLRDLEQAVAAFTKEALAATAGGGSYDTLSSAYAFLYQKQFKYDFYKTYQAQAPAATDNKADLTAAQQFLQENLKPFSALQRKKLLALFKDFRVNLVMGIGLPEILAYNYANRLLQSPASSVVIQTPF